VEDDEEANDDDMSVISKSNVIYVSKYQSKVYEMGTNYLRSNKSTEEQRQKYKESLIVKPPETKKRPDYLKGRDKEQQPDPTVLYRQRI
jgi:hypothetical protein